MNKPAHYGQGFKQGLAWILFCVFLAVLWLAGGASRADAMGQVVVRSVAAAVMIVTVLLCDRRPVGDARPVLFLLIATATLVLLQLVPLPPDVWQALPGRTILAEATAANGHQQPWRPWAIVPGATVNAAGSLFVPAAALLLVLSVNERGRRLLPGAMLCLIGASALLGLMQASGTGFDNPLINKPAGHVAGPFANRNHFALLLALGCLLLPVWAFSNGHQRWRVFVGLGLLVLFQLLILATGSRAGIGLGALALVFGFLLLGGEVRHAFRRYPRWVFPTLIAALIGTIAIFVLISVAADRAVSIDRALTIDFRDDMRSRGLPVIMEMIGVYFPFGSGFGGFDPVFRLHEPFDLLQPSYHYHAHNDLLEVALDGGLAGILLLGVGLLWWARSSYLAWRAGSGVVYALPKLGSAMLLLILIASVFDYPARTPLIMVSVIVAAFWLSSAGASMPDRLSEARRSEAG